MRRRGRTRAPERLLLCMEFPTHDRRRKEWAFSEGLCLVRGPSGSTSVATEVCVRSVTTIEGVGLKVVGFLLPQVWCEGRDRRTGRGAHKCVRVGVRDTGRNGH